MMNDDVEYVFKIVAVGMGGVGKTSLIRRFATGKFQKDYLMTLGVDFTTKVIHVKGKKIKIVCADTAGQVYYGNIRPNYYTGANAAFIVFDLTNRNSFDSLDKWVDELKMYIKNVPMAIVGNKLDLTIENETGRRIKFEEGEKYSKERNMSYFETSAKSAENVDKVFNELAIEIFNSNK